MLPERGAIHSPEAYARGKMLDHSQWQRGDKIVRLITPSDIDMCFDNKGRVLLCEVSSEHDTWDKVVLGQRRLYEGLVKSGAHCAALCKHSVRMGESRPIDSRNDIESFHVMLFDHELLFDGVYTRNDDWQYFVHGWFKDPLKMRRICLRTAVRAPG